MKSWPAQTEPTPSADLFSGLPVGDVQRLGELSELFVDVDALQAAPVRRLTLASVFNDFG